MTMTKRINPGEATEWANAAYLLMAQCLRELATAAGGDAFREDTHDKVEKAWGRYHRAVLRERRAGARAQRVAGARRA